MNKKTYHLAELVADLKKVKADFPQEWEEAAHTARMKEAHQAYRESITCPCGALMKNVYGEDELDCTECDGEFAKIACNNFENMEAENFRKEFDRDIVANIDFEECSLDPEDLFEWIQWKISLAEKGRTEEVIQFLEGIYKARDKDPKGSWDEGVTDGYEKAANLIRIHFLPQDKL